MMIIERYFDRQLTITGYRLVHDDGRSEPVARIWAEDQVYRGKARYVDVGRALRPAFDKTPAP